MVVKVDEKCKKCADRAMWVCLAGNVFLCAFKVIVGVLSGSLAVCHFESLTGTEVLQSRVDQLLIFHLCHPVYHSRGHGFNVIKLQAHFTSPSIGHRR